MPGLLDVVLHEILIEILVRGHVRLQMLGACQAFLRTEDVLRCVSSYEGLIIKGKVLLSIVKVILLHHGAHAEWP